MNLLSPLTGAPASPPRRKLLYGAVAATAAAAGAGYAWWKFRPHDVSGDAVQAVWSMRFETTGPAPLAMASLRGKPLVLNFWATWCPPCVEELPLLDAFYRQNSATGWQVVGLAIDPLPAVKSFLARTPVSFPIALAGHVGTELGKSLGNASGGLPFTVVFGSGGDVLQRRIGQITAADLEAWRRLS